MKSPDLDPLDQALECLAQDDALELPDPRLNERLLRAANARSRQPNRSIVRDSSWARAAMLMLVVGVSGVALGAGVGFERIKAWWYSIVIDGHEAGAVLEGAGSSEVEYVTPDGYRVSVRVGRWETEDHGQQTRIEVSEVGHGTIEHMVEEIRTPGPAGRPQSATAERLSREALDSAELLHTWSDPVGRRWSLWLGPDPEGPGSRLMLDEMDSTQALPVHTTLRTARRIAAGGHVSIEEHPGGMLEIALSDGRGWEIALMIGAPARPGESAASSGEAEQTYGDFSTPSGRVRVRVGD